MEKSHVKIVLKDMSVDVRIGLCPEEKKKPQQIIVNAELFVFAGDYLSETQESDIISYAYIRDAVKEWPKRPHTLLIETCMQELLDLCFEDPRVGACRVSILKPDIFDDAVGAGVEAYVLREDYEKTSPKLRPWP